jgi:hypothetical protein
MKDLPLVALHRGRYVTGSRSHTVLPTANQHLRGHGVIS